MGQNHSDMLCEDIFSGYIKYLHYKERPKCLLINKRTYNLYNNAYLEKDKKVFLHLKDILDNPQFFNVLLSDMYKDYINKQSKRIVNVLHEFTFTKRNFTVRKENNLILIALPLRIGLYCTENTNRSDIYQSIPINKFSIIDVHEKHLDNKISYIELFREYIHNDNNISRIFIHKNEIGLQTNMSDPNYVNGNMNDYNLCFMDSRGWCISCIDNNNYGAKKLHWDLLVEAMKDPIIIETLKILKEYDSFV
jgi:hypothetical protein